MVDHVESLREVKRHGQRAVQRTWLVETLGYSMCEGEEGENGGVVGTETMLGG